MITSAPINLKDIADIRYIKARPITARLSRVSLRQRMADESLINFMAQALGYRKASNAPQFAYIKLTTYRYQRRSAKEVVFTNERVVGHYELTNGKVTGKVIKGE